MRRIWAEDVQAGFPFVGHFGGGLGHVHGGEVAPLLCILNLLETPLDLFNHVGFGALLRSFQRQTSHTRLG